jgi:hypothetical protein
VERKSMHSIFAQIEQQRAQHDHERLQRQDAKQPGQRFGHDAHEKRRDTPMAKKNAKHSQAAFSENPARHLSARKALAARTRAARRKLAERTADRQPLGALVALSAARAASLPLAYDLRANQPAPV